LNFKVIRRLIYSYLRPQNQLSDGAPLGSKIQKTPV
jgi:hypothetical protein